MNLSQLFSTSSNRNSLLALFGGCFVLFGSFVFFLTLSHSFLAPILLIGIFITSIGVLSFGTKLFYHSSLDMRVIILFAFIFTSVLSSFTVPTIFSGRDQGSISEASYRLMQNGTLTFSSLASDAFFEIHEPGSAQNFPGFAYTKTGELITQFPLGYTSWLASFVMIFGEQGFVVGNAVLLFLSLLFFYALLRKFVHPFFAFSGFFLFSTSFILIWFTKMTLSENYALFLFLFLCFTLLSFLETKKIFFYGLSLLSASLLAFTRIEGFAFLGIVVSILYIEKNSRALLKQNLWRNIVLPLSLFCLVFILDFILNLPYYTMIGKALFKFLHITNNGLISATLTNESSSALWSSLFLYGLGTLFILGIISLFSFLKKRMWYALIPALLALPTFIYLIDPNISPDHPWMLRRFLFSIFPVLFFSATLGIAIFLSKNEELLFYKPQGKKLFFASILFLSLFLVQYPAFSYGLTFAENRGLKEQILHFSQRFSDTDLVLVDRNATGDNFSLMTGPIQYLTGKNIIYFFNPNDLKYLDTTAFTRIYLLVPENDQKRYQDIFNNHLIFREKITFQTERLKHMDIELFPGKSIVETANSLFEIY